MIEINRHQPLAGRALRATLLTFFLSGLMIATFMSRIPALRDALNLSPARMGDLLLIGSLGSFACLPLSGPLVAKIGPRLSVWSSFVISYVGALGLAVGYRARSLVVFALFLFIYQAGLALWNSSMNVEGGFVQHLYTRAVLGWFHAAFSVGTVTGALIGALVITLGIDLSAHLLGMATLAAVGIFFAGRAYVPEHLVAEMASTSEGAGARTRRAWRERRTVLIGVMALGTALMEGSANDWLALAVVDGFDMPKWAGTLALALFLTVLTGTRMLSSRLSADAAPVRLQRALVATAIFGLLSIALSPWLWLVVVGIVAWGCGAALGFPLAAGALCRDASMAAARMSVLSTIGYGAFLAGPPIIGYIAEHVGYRGALGFVAIPAVMSLILASQLRETRSLK